MIPVLLKMADDELMASWLQSLAKVNCMPTEEFSSVYLDTKRTFKPWRYPPFLERICIRNSHLSFFPDVWTALENHTDYFMISAGLSRGMAAYRLEGILHSSLSTKYDGGYKICPQCEMEDLKTFGRSIVHVPHQCEGVTVCWKHGCPLYNENGYLEASNLDVEQKIAVFAHELYSNSNGMNFEYAQTAIEKWCVENDFNTPRLVDAAIDAGYIHEADKSITYRRFYHPGLSKEQLIRLFPFMYPSVTDLLIAGNYSLCYPHDADEFTLEENNHWVGKYRCRDCRRTFYRHEFAVTAGLTCPHCSNSLDYGAQMQRLLKRYKDGQYIFTDDTYSKILHKPCGGIILIDSKFWAVHSDGCQNCEKHDLEFWQQVFEKTDFQVISVSNRSSSQTRKTPLATLTLEHSKCGKHFETPGQEFYYLADHINVRCPYCEDTTVSTRRTKYAEIRIGLYRKSFTGIGATVIEYNGVWDILLRLDNGLERRTNWNTFCRIGTKKRERMPEFYIGSEWTLKDGTHCVITDYHGFGDLTLTFDDGKQIKSTLCKLRFGVVKGH